MNHVRNYYRPHAGGISRFIKSSQISACHCKMNVCKQAAADRVHDKGADAERADVTTAEMSGVRLHGAAAMSSSLLLFFFGASLSHLSDKMENPRQVCHSIKSDCVVWRGWPYGRKHRSTWKDYTTKKKNCQDEFIRQPLSFSPLIWPTNQPMHPQCPTKNISPPLSGFLILLLHVCGRDPTPP